MKFAVITTNSFEEYTPVKLFATYEEARKYLKNIYQNKLCIDAEENRYGVTSCYDGDFAEITQHFPDHKDTIRFFIGDII